METAASDQVRIPMRWSRGRKWGRFLILFIPAVTLGCIAVIPLVRWNPDLYLPAYSLVPAAAMIIVALRIRGEERRSTLRDGPFIVFENGRTSLVLNKQPVVLTIADLAIDTWQTAAYRYGSRYYPPMAHLMLSGSGYRLVFLGGDHIADMSDFPLVPLNTSYKTLKGTYKISLYAEDVVLAYKSVVESLHRIQSTGD